MSNHLTVNRTFISKNKIETTLFRVDFDTNLEKGDLVRQADHDLVVIRYLVHFYANLSKGRTNGANALEGNRKDGFFAPFRNDKMSTG